MPVCGLFFLFIRSPEQYHAQSDNYCEGWQPNDGRVIVFPAHRCPFRPKYAVPTRHNRSFLRYLPEIDNLFFLFQHVINLTIFRNSGKPKPGRTLPFSVRGRTDEGTILLSVDCVDCFCRKTCAIKSAGCPDSGGSARWHKSCSPEKIANLFCPLGTETAALLFILLFQ